jgi:hypothetical protein
MDMLQAYFENNKIYIVSFSMPPEILLNAMRSVIHRCQQCLEQNGAQFEQFRRKNYIVIFIVRINE